MSDLSFGKRLRALRMEAKLSQNEMADKLAISRQSISKWEQDICLPQINYLVPLTQMLNCSLEDLILNKISE